MLQEKIQRSPARKGPRKGFKASSKALLRRNKELSLINAIAVDMGGRVAIPLLLEHAVEKMIEVLGLDGVCLLLLPMEQTASPGNLEPAIADRCSHFCWSGCDTPDSLRTKRCWLAMAELWERLGQGQPYSQSHKPLAGPCPCPAVGNNPDIHYDVIPLMADEKLLGLMSVRKGAAPLDLADLLTLTTIGRQLGVAIENRRLWERLEESEKKKAWLLTQVIQAQEEERKRIARELHDETSQALAALSVGLKAAAMTIGSDESQGQALLEKLKNQAGRMIGEIHQIIYDLRPSLLDDLGLLPAIRWLVAHRLEPVGIEPRFRIEGQAKRLPMEIETTLFRIVQEALKNTVKHAGANRVEVAIGFSDQVVTLRIEDDGRGFDPQRAMAGRKGLGLMGMAERAALIGGTWEVHSQPGQGTSIELAVPLQPEVAGQDYPSKEEV